MLGGDGRDKEVPLMCYSGICDFEAGGDRAGECAAPRGFRERYGVSPCIVGGCYEDPDDERWAEEVQVMLDDELKAASEALAVIGDRFQDMLRCVGDALPRDAPQGRQRFAGTRRGKLPRAPRKMR